MSSHGTDPTLRRADLRALHEAREAHRRTGEAVQQAMAAAFPRGCPVNVLTGALLLRDPVAAVAGEEPCTVTAPGVPAGERIGVLTSGGCHLQVHLESLHEWRVFLETEGLA